MAGDWDKAVFPSVGINGSFMSDRERKLRQSVFVGVSNDG